MIKVKYNDLIENGSNENTMDVVAYIYKMVAKQKEAINTNASFEIMKQIASKLPKKDKKEIQAKNSSFIREGDLIKINQSGGETIYRFILFSDTLIYCHQSLFGEYKVHESLSLIDMSLSDLTNDSTFCSFSIKHPTKSFVVIADNVDLKYSWLSDIEKAIENCNGNQLRYRKLSVVSKLEDEFGSKKISLKKVPVKDNGNLTAVGNTVNGTDGTDGTDTVNKTVSFA